MAIVWQFEWYTEDGSPFITIEQWIETLSAEEQKEFYEAVKRQHEFRSKKIEEGNLIIKHDEMQYIWKDEIAEEVNKENDPIWLNYFDRWQVETKSRCRVIKKEI